MSTRPAPSAAARRPGANGQPAATEPASFFSWENMSGSLRTMAMVWIGTQLVQVVMNKALGPKNPINPTAPDVTTFPTDGSSPVAQTSKPANSANVLAVPMWPASSKMDMYVFFSDSPEGEVDFDAALHPSSSPASTDAFPHTIFRGIEYGSSKINDAKDFEIPIPSNVQRNASLWADIFLTNGKASPNPRDPSYSPASVLHVRKLLTRYHKKKIIRKEKNLLSGKKEDTKEAEQTPEEIEAENRATPIVSHWHQNLTLAIVQPVEYLNYGQMPPEAKQYVHLEPSGQTTVDGKHYHYPIVFANDFWNMREHMTEINTTTSALPLRVTVSSLANWKFTLYSTVGASFEQQAVANGGNGGEMDQIKLMLTDTNPILLATTVLVTILHMLFEFLAFSSDVGHWRKKGKENDLVGVSLRTIITNCIVQFITLLYLMDNNTDTSWMILFSQGMGLLIEAWKITKIVDIKLLPSAPGSRLPYTVTFEDKKILTEDEKKTQEYDALAFRIVTWVAVPCLGAYTVYSLIYDTHRSWYSFIVTTLAGFCYTSAFATLVPQLIINYKLKSVAHMPMKAMVYKTLSTVVDDFFSFVVPMPMLHRLACFKDDVVFVVLLYQRWIYRVDPRRANEYGQVFEIDEEEEKAKELEGESKKDK